jgi:hypothetical protein
LGIALLRSWQGRNTIPGGSASASIRKRNDGLITVLRRNDDRTLKTIVFMDGKDFLSFPEDRHYQALEKAAIFPNTLCRIMMTAST